MARMEITPADLDYAAAQLEDKSSLMFGSRPWEQYITLNEPELWLALVGDCGGDDANREMRQLLTLIYAPIFRRMEGSLPSLTQESLADLAVKYPTADSNESAQGRLKDLMDACQSAWSAVVLHYLRRSSLKPERLHFVYRYALLLMESIGTLPEIPISQPLDPPKRVPEPAVTADRHEAPKIEPVTDNSVRLSDIGGYDDIKAQLGELAKMFNHAGVLERWAVDVPRGILLSGPPGVGKTYWAYALANEINKPFFDVKRTKVTSAYVNESSKWVDGMFDQVKKAGGGIIFLDEVDGLIFSRESTTSQAAETCAAIVCSRA
jgi:hypothetical protein